jgi:hypothetical protein
LVCEIFACCFLWAGGDLKMVQLVCSVGAYSYFLFLSVQSDSDMLFCGVTFLFVLFSDYLLCVFFIVFYIIYVRYPLYFRANNRYPKQYSKDTQDFGVLYLRPGTTSIS